MSETSESETSESETETSGLQERPFSSMSDEELRDELAPTFDDEGEYVPGDDDVLYVEAEVEE